MWRGGLTRMGGQGGVMLAVNIEGEIVTQLGKKLEGGAIR